MNFHGMGKVLSCYNAAMSGREKEPKTDLGRRLRQLRKHPRCNLSIAGQAQRCHVSESQYGRYERGDAIPPPKILIVIAAALGVPAGELAALVENSEYREHVEYAESTGSRGPEVHEETPPVYVGRLPEQDSPQIGTVGEDGLVELEQPLEGIAVFTVYVLAESLGRYQKGDRLIAGTEIVPDRRPCIVKEADGTLRLVRRARMKGDLLEVQPLSALGQRRFQPLAGGEIVAVVIGGGWTE